MHARRFRIIQLFLILALPVVAVLDLPAQTAADWELRDRRIEAALRAPAQGVSRFHPGKIEEHQIAVRVEQRELELSADDIAKYRQLSRNKLVRIDYVTHACANDVGVVNDTVDRQRLERLYDFNADLFHDKEIRWGRINQTGCQFEYQAQDFFHGFVLTLEHQPGNGTNNFLAARLKHAEKHEYIEGDVLDEVRRWNAWANGGKGHRPPETFSPGHVSDIQSPAQRKTEQDGFALQFPDGGPMPAPTICDDTLYVSGGFHSRSYHAYRLKDGAHIWSKGLSDNGPSTAACFRGIIFFNTESCTLFALDGKSGNGKWSHFLGDPLATTPAADDGLVYTVYPAAAYPATEQGNTPTHVMIALDTTSGKIVWQRWVDSEVLQVPVIAGDSVIMTSGAGIVYRFERKSGKILFAQRLRSTATPVFHDGSWYFSKRAGTAQSKTIAEALAVLTGDSYRLASPPRDAPYIDRRIQDRGAYSTAMVGADGRNGFFGGAPVSAHAEAPYIHIGRKSVSSLQAYEGGRVLVHDERLIVSAGNALVAYESGESAPPVWTLEVPGDLEKTGGALLSAPALAGGYVFVSTLAGEVWQIDPSEGKVVKRYTVGEPLRVQPVIHDGRIYAATTEGRLRVIDTGDRTLTGWTTFGGDSKRNGGM